MCCGKSIITIGHSESVGDKFHLPNSDFSIVSPLDP